MKTIKIVLITLGVLVLLFPTLVLFLARKEPLIIPIKGNLQFTAIFDSSATLLIPAAYTLKDGTIEGEYRIAGKTFGTPTRKERISLHPTKGLIISGKWHSDYGFQQTVLIKNRKIRYHDDPHKRFRRALATVDGQLCILQSCIPMTLNQFSESIQPYCTNAVNLDMGDYGYGWYNSKKFSWWAKYNQNNQTNWIYIPWEQLL